MEDEFRRATDEDMDNVVKVEDNGQPCAAGRACKLLQAWCLLHLVNCVNWQQGVSPTTGMVLDATEQQRAVRHTVWQGKGWTICGHGAGNDARDGSWDRCARGPLTVALMRSKVGRGPEWKDACEVCPNSGAAHWSPCVAPRPFEGLEALYHLSFS